MLVGDDAIDKNGSTLLLPNRQQLHDKRDSLNVPRGSLLFDPGG